MVHAYLFIAISAFAASVAVNIAAEITGKRLLKIISKPLLMPLLLLCYLLASRDADGFIIAALLFAFAGDVLLLSGKRSGYFVAGLAAFVLCHLCYILFFLQEGILHGNIPLYFWIALIPYCMTGIIAFGKLRNHLGRLAIPVAVYIIALLFMSFLCAARGFRFEGFAFWLPLCGSVLFVLSDALLAFHRFRKPVRHGGFYIMSAYVLAQMLIIAGISAAY